MTALELHGGAAVEPPETDCLPDGRSLLGRCFSPSRRCLSCAFACTATTDLQGAPTAPAHTLSTHVSTGTVSFAASFTALDRTRLLHQSPSSRVCPLSVATRAQDWRLRLLLGARARLQIAGTRGVTHCHPNASPRTFPTIEPCALTDGAAVGHVGENHGLHQHFYSMQPLSLNPQCRGKRSIIWHLHTDGGGDPINHHMHGGLERGHFPTRSNSLGVNWYRCAGSPGNLAHNVVRSNRSNREQVSAVHRQRRTGHPSICILLASSRYASLASLNVS